MQRLESSYIFFYANSLFHGFADAPGFLECVLEGVSLKKIKKTDQEK